MRSRSIAIASALACAALVFDPLAPAAVVKASLLLVVSLALAAIGWRRWRLSLGGALLALLCGWLGLSLSWSKTPAATELAPWLAAALACFSLAGLDGDERRLAAGRFAAIILAASGGMAFAQWLTARATDGGHGNPNWLGLVVAVCMPLAWDRARARGAARFERVASHVALVLGCAALALSASRAAWLAIGVAIAMGARGRWRLLAAPAAIALIYAAWRSDLASAAAGRWWIARASWRAAMASLPLGAGLGSFSTAYLDAQAELLAGVEPSLAAQRFLNATTAHDDWLQLLVDGGPVAALLGLVWAIACLATLAGWPAARASVIAASIAAIGDSAMALPGVAIAMAFVSADTPLLNRRASDAAMALAALGAAAALLPLTLRRYGAERTMHVALREQTAAAQIGGLDRACAIDPTSGEAAFALGIAWLEQGEPARAIADLERSRMRLANVGTVIALGNAQLASERTRQAIELYREALRWDPGSFRARANLVEALRRAGDFDGAERELAVARQLQPHHPKLARIAEELRRARIDADTR